MFSVVYFDNGIKHVEMFDNAAIAHSYSFMLNSIDIPAGMVKQ